MMEVRRRNRGNNSYGEEDSGDHRDICVFVRGLDDFGDVDLFADGECGVGVEREGGVDVGRGAGAAPSSGELPGTRSEDGASGRERAEGQENGNGERGEELATGFEQDRGGLPHRLPAKGIAVVQHVPSGICG